jgi:hypothetical protein
LRSPKQQQDEKKPVEELVSENASVAEAMELVASCNSFSELIDKLSIENVRLWHVLDDTVALKKRLDEGKLTERERVEILEKIAKKSFENIETVKRRSIFKKAIDELFAMNVQNIMQGKRITVTDESKSYGR